MPIRRLLSACAATFAAAAVMVLATAGPALAHTATFTRSCHSVELMLRYFHDASRRHPNVVTVLRNGKRIGLVRFTGKDVDHTYSEAVVGTVTYQAIWTKTGLDHNSGRKWASLGAPTPAACGVTAAPAAAPTHRASQPGAVPVRRHLQAAASPAVTPAVSPAAPPDVIPATDPIDIALVGVAGALGLIAIGLALAVRMLRRA